MKKAVFFLFMTHFISLPMQAQTHFGSNAGTLGSGHSYFGSYAGNAALGTSYNNSFFGAYSGRHTTTGYGNTAMGSNALYTNTEGYNNTGIGDHALYGVTSGAFQVAIGRLALYSYQAHSYNATACNTANGYRASFSATTAAFNNTATGAFALYNTLNGGNTGTGFRALYNHATVYYNTATGAYAMENGAQYGNTAFGFRSLSSDADGYNSAFGWKALYPENSTPCIGVGNTAFGTNAGIATTAECDLSSTTALGYNAKVTASYQVRIGNSSVTSIGGQVAWSNLSDGRFKTDLKNDVPGLDFVNQINPVSYFVDKEAVDKFFGIPDSLVTQEADAKKTSERRIGFVAQEVEAVINKSGYVFSGVEVPQNENDPYTIRYAEFVAPLVKAIQELSLLADARQKQITDLAETLRAHLEDTLAQKKQLTSPTLVENSTGKFAGVVEIQIALPETARAAHLIIYNKEGKQLKDIQVYERGIAIAKISLDEFSPGVYLYALIADGDVVATNRITLE